MTNFPYNLKRNQILYLCPSADMRDIWLWRDLSKDLSRQAGAQGLTMHQLTLGIQQKAYGIAVTQIHRDLEHLQWHSPAAKGDIRTNNSQRGAFSLKRHIAGQYRIF